MSLILNKNNVNLGTVKLQNPQTIIVGITNNGSETIRNFSAKTSCGSCTTASLSKNTIEPGETISMTVVFTPKSTGYNIKTVTINNSLIFYF